MTPKVLVVDDERNTREGLRRALSEKYDVVTAAGGRRALEILQSDVIAVMLTDLRMPEMDGLTLIQRALALDPAPICIVLTAYGTVERAVEAMRRGAYDFLTKPVNLDKLEMVVERALKQRETEDENVRLRRQLSEKYGFENIIGASDAMRSVFEVVEQVAPTRATVLIEGESGTGKELVAQAIHQLSPRAKGPHVVVHCAALSSSLLESELFGHEKGAFTGAAERRLGRFELADGGTLFLDEVSAIPAETQVKILRVLEAQRFERVGGERTIEVDVRVVAASNRDLGSMVEEGVFREDLFYRLNVVTVSLPPLRERREDIPLLVNHFIGTFSEQNGKSVTGITSEAMQALAGYDWPGNVRELRNTVERMVVLTRGDRITVRDVPAPIRPRGGTARSPSAVRSGMTVQEAERELIAQTLREQNGNRTRAAELLGISRRTLHRKLREYNLADI
jgi:DNA-binding NtrC family response regulator